ncbi:hypothetical protein CGZ75_12275 [Paenibacillus herberti]|uniref:Uncharacterized protein n=1 Tax=Paenibacillus herberti TaxID=1619309 RepID=A0A229P504_9BACL|nr:hypothetical protein CGZ75_12275 [Paenibacillus herberti]
MFEPKLDEFGRPMCRSGVAEWIWAFYRSDPRRFKEEVKKHFELGYPNYTVRSANYEQRVIWLQENRSDRL